MGVNYGNFCKECIVGSKSDLGASLEVCFSTLVVALFISGLEFEDFLENHILVNIGSN